MQGQHALAKREPDQVKALGIDFEGGVQLVNAIPPLHTKMLLQTNG
jgi:hypothetical protein